MITRNKIAKAYEAMQPEQLAAIAFQNVMKKDATKFDRVMAAVPRKTYNAMDYNYRTRLSSLFDFADYWTIQRQRHVIDMLSLQIKIHEIIQSIGQYKHGTDEFISLSERLDKLMVQSHRLDGLLAAMDEALEAICNELGLDVELIRQFAGCNPLPAGFAKPDAAYLAEMTEICRAIALGNWPDGLLKEMPQ